MPRNPWLTPGLGEPSAALRLYCFPYAGGSASVFHSWRAALAPEIDVIAVQMPGRAERLLDPMPRRIEPLLAALAEAIAPRAGRRFAFFGHSLGGLVAFELARLLQRRGADMPERVIVSGCDAPGHRKADRALHRLDDEAFVQVLRGYNGTPPEILANRELLRLLLPAVRADFEISENYVPLQDAPLNRPLTVLAGVHDERDSDDAVDGWSRETRAGCDVHWFDGDHFFINPHRDAVLACVRRALAPAPQPLSACP